MLNNRSALRVFAVAFPLVMILGWAISVQLTHDGGTTVRLKIVGYDPVDLLSGHYLRFRYDLGKADLCEGVPNKMATCACLVPADQGTMEAEYGGDCQTLQKSCQTFIKGSCQYSTFLTSSERFYFPEEYTSVLAVVPPESQAEVAIAKDGGLSLKSIYVKDLDILSYAKDRIRFPNKRD